MSPTPSQKQHWDKILQSKPIKRGLLIFWLALVLSGLGYFLFNIQDFTPKNIAAFLKDYESALLLSYFVISLMRGFF